MTYLGHPNQLSSPRRKPEPTDNHTAMPKDEVRTSCKACRTSILTSEPAVWVRGRLVGLVHVPCSRQPGLIVVTLAQIQQPAAAKPATPAREQAPAIVRGRADLLTPRQRQMLQLKADGLDTAAIAAQLRVSPTTVGNIQRQARDRLGAVTVDEAVTVAARHGLIRTSEPKG